MNNKRKDAIHRVLKITITIICIALAYTGLSAQSKGFTDTVILKNGTVLTGVKAVVTKDSLVVTTSEGETSVFTKKEVSEVKKGGGGNSTNTPKPAPSSGKWSAYQGEMNWNDANRKCESLGMRLPTRDEFVTAHKAGLQQKWQGKATNGHSAYWTSEENSDESAYYFNIDLGVRGNGDSHKDYGTNHVRCVR